MPITNHERYEHVSALFPSLHIIKDLRELTHFEKNNLLLIDESLNQLFDHKPQNLYLPTVHLPKGQLILDAIE
ncbi:hypothetical protein SCQ32_09465 [Streptococcus canis]|uniref:hypothetical protein n=1 Tax=Streptococcus canis TaxID=1329 RepID=UPI0002F64CDF|nr:hypothetical protein [Streptococcus canis]MDW7799536.1 hypothetical protein [Streptococcus canis]GEE07090.1 hypothetical protein ScOT1_11830 [Streptococcus canis]GFE45194.1 hypothetical protein ScFU6_09630 [Streptococcus canis]GFK30882.1 hypothetical protein ScFU149_09980 [Streptococcus canis]